ncbi:hypothetical protein JCM15640A_04250 [Hoylesella timonensis 4401737 = DSM 22865 = JCM 15640]|uniref:DUF6531 domain-containing protein n=2 Tax=Hoylesella timonensis TaxID=386414 RepID=UPI00040F09A9|nr:DUF6531 domain-containing protein [Hoylesella timonensis]
MLHFTRSLKKELSFYGFEPVNLITGSVLYEGMDFSFPGALPLEWKRVYHSDSNFKGAFGIGVHSLADMRLFLYPIAQCIGSLLADGRICGFDYVEEGEVDFCRVNRLELRKHPNGYEVYDLEKRLFYNFEYFNRFANSYLLTSVTDLDGRSIRLSYENGVLATLTDACGRRVTVRHTDAGFIESLHLRMPDGSSEQLVRYSYDGQGNMVGITDALGQTTGIRYEDHRMVAKTDRNGYTFCWEYDKEGRCVHTRGADGDQEGWISYFPEQGYNTVRDACGAESTYRYDANQLVRSVTDALGNTTRYDYTEEMEPYREIDPEGRITGWHYDGRGNQTGTTYPDGALSMRVFDEQDLMILHYH